MTGMYGYGSNLVFWAAKTKHPTEFNTECVEEVESLWNRQIHVSDRLHQTSQ